MAGSGAHGGLTWMEFLSAPNREISVPTSKAPTVTKSRNNEYEHTNIDFAKCDTWEITFEDVTSMIGVNFLNSSSGRISPPVNPEDIIPGETLETEKDVEIALVPEIVKPVLAAWRGHSSYHQTMEEGERPPLAAHWKSPENFAVGSALPSSSYADTYLYNVQEPIRVTFANGDTAEFRDIRVVGETKLSYNFNPGWRKGNRHGSDFVNFHQVLSQAHCYMHRRHLRYGYIWTDKIIILLRRRAEDGALDISDPIPFSNNGPGVLTCRLALLYLALLGGGKNKDGEGGWSFQSSYFDPAGKPIPGLNFPRAACWGPETDLELSDTPSAGSQADVGASPGKQQYLPRGEKRPRMSEGSQKKRRRVNDAGSTSVAVAPPSIPAKNTRSRKSGKKASGSRG